VEVGGGGSIIKKEKADCPIKEPLKSNRISSPSKKTLLILFSNCNLKHRIMRAKNKGNDRKNS
jgi:hypothetical protein